MNGEEQDRQITIKVYSEDCTPRTVRIKVDKVDWTPRTVRIKVDEVEREPVKANLVEENHNDAIRNRLLSSREERED